MSASRNQLAAGKCGLADDAADLEARWPDLTVNDGRRTLGYVFVEDDGSMTATDALGGMLGKFENVTPRGSQSSNMRWRVMTELVKKPILKVRVGDGLFAREMSIPGRFAWTLHELHKAGLRGCTPIERPAPRWSHYVWRLRHDWGLDIETINESHSGPYAGSHARYVLRTPIEILEGAVP